MGAGVVAIENLQLPNGKALRYVDVLNSCAKNSFKLRTTLGQSRMSELNVPALELAQALAPIIEQASITQ